jgi:hypothetical protein
MLENRFCRQSKEPSSAFRVESGLVHSLAELIDSPRALTIALLLESGEYQQLVDLEIDPSHYSSPQAFAEDYLVTEILSKSKRIPLDIDRKAVALEGFHASEVCCTEVNNLFSLPETVHPDWLWLARHNVANILGDFRPDEALRHMRFGPGATTSVRGRGLAPSDKFDGEIHLTHSLMPFVRSLMGENWWDYHRESFTIVRGSKLAVVPKNAKKDRVICIEPSLNIFMQLGIGEVMRRRLKRQTGIDLNSQERNRLLAKLAYKDDLVTLDLSAASDSVSRGLVEYLLPKDWLHACWLCRSPWTLVDGEWIELQKWSSMGSGYTFELMTLVAYSTCASIVPLCELDKVSVFGDDIIVPRAYAGRVIDALNYLGFSVNMKKSHLAGDFFESCGEHYFQGCSVKPFYARDDAETYGGAPYTVKLANKLYRFATQLTGHPDRRYLPVWIELFNKAPKDWQCLRVPLELGDVGFTTGPSGAIKRHSRDGWEGYWIKTAQQKVGKVRKTTYGVLLAKQVSLQGESIGEPPTVKRSVCPQGTSLSPTLGWESRRGIFGRLVKRWTFIPEWSGLDWA